MAFGEATMEEWMSDLVDAARIAEELGCTPADVVAAARELRREQVILICRPVVAEMWRRFDASGRQNTELATLHGCHPSQVGRWPRQYQFGDTHVYAAAAVFQELMRDDETATQRVRRRLTRTVTLLRALLDLPAFRWPAPPAPLPAGWGDITPSEWECMAATFEIDASLDAGPVFPHSAGQTANAIDARLNRVLPRFRGYDFLQAARPPLGRWRDLYRRLQLPFAVLVWVLCATPWNDDLLPEPPARPAP